MNLQLHSDFIDYYDAEFDFKDQHDNSQTFYRMRNQEYNRNVVYEKLAKNNYSISFHLGKKTIAAIKGTNKQYKDILPIVDRVLVYEHLNHNAHKKMYSVKELQERKDLQDNYFSAPFINTLNEKTNMYETYRVFNIGSKRFFFKYSSTHWNTNINPTIEYIKPSIINEYKDLMDLGELGDTEHETHTLNSFTYIKCADAFFAIDYNKAPILKNTPIVDLLNPSEVIELIKEDITKKFDKSYNNNHPF